MLVEVKKLHGLAIHALDGEVGSVDEFLFDDEFWTVRYLIVNTGSWLMDRKVLISPLALGGVDWDKKTLTVNLTCDQIEKSPGVETDQPVSRQWEIGYYDYYSLPYYWDGVSGWGAYLYSGGLLAQTVGSTEILQHKADHQARQDAEDCAHERADAHLRSTKEVTGYGISATDGHLGHVTDFIVNDETWRISYLTVDTQNWWPGKSILLPPEWITRVSWSERSVSVNVTRDQVKGAPEWEAEKIISRAFETQLYAYYDRQHPEETKKNGELRRKQ
ncbi:PRC-barrel domain containing protein [Armatimonas sp.]|uniref:PRC-barrel domain containing protein n=1 Tax=Armatimonas sp. TaxID=1872638 RepID=UPI0037517400